MKKLKGQYIEFRVNIPQSIYMGDNNYQSVLGIGDIAIRIYDSIVKQLKNVIHVSNLKRNLISLGILEDEGHFFRV